jgi:hypothetical protein
MEHQSQQLSPLMLEVYDSFIHAWRQPHLPMESFLNRAPYRFERLIKETVNELIIEEYQQTKVEILEKVKEFERAYRGKLKPVESKLQREPKLIEQVELVVENPFSATHTYIRYGYLKPFIDRVIEQNYYQRKAKRLKESKESESVNLEIEEYEANFLKLKATTDISALSNHVVPTPPTICTALRLFEIEKEHDRLLEVFKQVISNPDLNVKTIKRFGNSSLQLLKILARQLQEYDDTWKNIEGTQLSQEERTYIVYVLKRYVTKTILSLQDFFEPYLTVTLLTEADINEIYFKGLLHNVPVEQVTVLNPTIPVKQEKGWYPLFKNTNAADQIMQLLQEEEYVAADRHWIANPQLLTMIALYNTLQKQGYLKTSPVSAQALANAFNQQFHTNFSHKKWQPAERESANIYREMFLIIPEFKS